MASRSQPECAAAPATSRAEPSGAFTPGPWYADDGWSGAWGIFARSDDEAVAYCWEPHGGPRLPRDLANARLIAAAPDLLAALRRMHTASVAGAMLGYIEHEKWADELYASHGQAFDALKKALGTSEAQS